MLNICLAVLIYAVIRMFGGRDDQWLKDYKIPFDNKIWKRWIAPIFLGLTVIVLSKFHWLSFLYAIAEAGSAWMDGYGNDSGKVWREVLQRIFSALASTVPCVLLAFMSGSWWLLIIQLIVALIVKIGMNFLKIPPFKIGKKFKVDSAMSEEIVINFSSSVFKPFLAILRF